LVSEKIAALQFANAAADSQLTRDGKTEFRRKSDRLSLFAWIDRSGQNAPLLIFTIVHLPEIVGNVEFEPKAGNMRWGLESVRFAASHNSFGFHVIPESAVRITFCRK